MKSAASVLVLTLLTGCSGMPMHGDSGAQQASAYDAPMRYSVFAPNYPTANPNNPVHDLYFGD